MSTIIIFAKTIHEVTLGHSLQTCMYLVVQIYTNELDLHPIRVNFNNWVPVALQRNPKCHLMYSFGKIHDG